MQLWHQVTKKKMWKRGETAPKEQFLLFSTLFYIYIFLTSGVKLHIHLFNVLFNLLFSSLSQLWYVEVRISRSVSVSPLEFEITRVDCSLQQRMAIRREKLAHDKSLLCCSLWYAYNNMLLSAGKYKYHWARAFHTRLHVRLANTKITLRGSVFPVRWRRFGPLATDRMSCEDSDQTAWMWRLIWVLAVRLKMLCPRGFIRFSLISGKDTDWIWCKRIERGEGM